MAKTTIITLLPIIFLFPFGQLLRINLGQISFPAIDLSVFVFFIINLINLIKRKKLKIHNKYLFYFFLLAWFSYIINTLRYQILSIKPILYLIRFTIYFSFFIFPPQLKTISTKIKNLFQLSLIATIVFGIIQYFLWPNFTYFDSFNWDPHLYRLVGSFLDPAFTGLIFLLFLLQIFLNPEQKFKKPLIILTYLAIALSYSRSTLISFLFAFFLISKHLKNKKIFLISLIITLATILLLPRQPGEGTKLERTSSIKAKIENYKEALSVTAKSPIIGHGYNNLYFVRKINNPQSHANFGFDNSLLTILSTTGIIGFCLFLSGLVTLIKKSSPPQKILISTVILHSFFTNSLLYPWVLIFLLINQIS